MLHAGQNLLPSNCLRPCVSRFWILCQAASSDLTPSPLVMQMTPFFKPLELEDSLNWSLSRAFFNPPYSCSRALQAGFTEGRQHVLRGVESTSENHHAQNRSRPARIPGKATSQCSFYTVESFQSFHCQRLRSWPEWPSDTGCHLSVGLLRVMVEVGNALNRI